MIEEEKKAREFHARPIPKVLYKTPQVRLNNTILKRNNSMDAIKKTTEAPAVTTFKARSARVLHVEPFIPKRSEQPLAEISEFRLNTMTRAEQREHFDALQREREQREAEMRTQEKVMQQLAEQQSIMEQRKNAEFRANPIRVYRNVKRFSPKGPTVPISPTFETDLIRNKENKALLD